MREISRLRSLLGELRRDEDGGVLIYFTLLIIVMMGMIGLVLEGGSLLHLNSDLQELADAAALAGAAELDGAKDAITRATNKAENLLTNNVNWSNVAVSGVQINAPTFYRSLNPDTATTDPAQANYIKVTTVTRSVKPSFLVAVGAKGNDSTSATAMAQATYSMCAPLQSFMCNPYEASETNPGNANNFSAKLPVGTMILLLNKFVSGGTGGGAPGNWGLLMAPNENSNPNNQTPFWAESSAGSCSAASNPSSTDTGNVAKFAQPGMNVRFDSPIGTSDQSLSAPVVIDGFLPSSSDPKCNRYDPTTGKTQQVSPTGFDPTNYSATCNATTSSSFSCPLPRDRLVDTTIIGGGPNITDLQAYWKNHHAGSLPAGVTNRYQIYQQEVSGAAPFTAASEKAEPHAPMCAKATVGDQSRRLINVAIVDCSYWGITGKKTLPQTTLYAQFFMTEPADSSGNIYGEYVTTYGIGTNSASPNAPGNAIHQIVQLVR